MKRILLILLVFTAAVAYANEKPKPSFVYDLDFEMRFDNREFAKSSFTPSMTIFGARLSPQIGLALNERGGAEHRLMVGIDVMKDFGASPVSELLAGGKTDETSSRLDNFAMFREMTLYYRFHKRFARTDMEIFAGVFPRSTMEGSWSPAMFSDSLVFYDNNLEGLLLKFRREKAYFEVGCDWMGQYGRARREKFMIFTAGQGEVLPFMSLGYAGYMLHYANSQQVKGLVDNFLVNPYACFEIGQYTGMQEFSFRLGWLQAMQRDRKHVGAFVFPFGGEFDQHVRNWNVGIHNRMFFGHDMMPYYNNVDEGGFKYGPDLYFGDPFYRVHDNGKTGAGFYDRLEVYYEPQIADFLSLKVSALFHFNGSRYSGCQQMVGLKFNLERCLNRTNK
jgi:hypothetical protein